MANYEPRFIVTRKEGCTLKESGMMQVIVDRETGINYLWVKSGYCGGLTPLLDANGKPIVTKLDE